MARARRRPEDLPSHRWYGGNDLRATGHHSRTLQMGYGREEFLGKPVIGIINTWSDINPCHAHFRARAGEVKRGVWQAGGFPLEMPAIALAEPFQKPSTMLYRNFLAMETEELLRSYPVDGAVLMGGCDKTTPALIMGATSMGLPFIYMPAGPMLRGNWHGEQLGSGTDRWKYWAELRAGRITEDDWREVEEGIARFRAHPECFVLVCDRSGEEGRNLQFADRVVHFDLPLSPNRMEQRIGRLDRIGRDRPVRSTIFVGPECEGSLFAAWYAVLNDGFRVFDHSIATGPGTGISSS